MVRLLTFSVLILLLAAPAVASAGTREKILRECQSGRITGDYTPGQIRDARKNIPTDIDEYSDCRDVLARAALAGRSNRGGTGGGGAGGPSAGTSAVAAPGGIQPSGAEGAVVPAKEEEKQLEQARKAAPVAVDGERIVPGASGFAADAARHGLPTTLLWVLILLGLCALAAFVPAVRRRVIARRKP